MPHRSGEKPGRAADPRPARTRAAILDAIERLGAKGSDLSVATIVAEAQLSRSLAETVAREAGLRLGLLDPTGGDGVAGRDSYEALLRYNAAELQKALRP